jgi:hypothetical protein
VDWVVVVSAGRQRKIRGKQTAMNRHKHAISHEILIKTCRNQGSSLRRGREGKIRENFQFPSGGEEEDDADFELQRRKKLWNWNWLGFCDGVLRKMELNAGENQFVVDLEGLGMMEVVENLMVCRGELRGGREFKRDVESSEFETVSSLTVEWKDLKELRDNERDWLERDRGRLERKLKKKLGKRI